MSSTSAPDDPLQQDIAAVEQKIAAVEQEIEEAGRSVLCAINSGNQVLQQYYVRKEEQLRDEKKQLRDEKKQLRERLSRKEEQLLLLKSAAVRTVEYGQKDVTFELRNQMAVPARPLPHYQQLKQFVSQRPQVLFPVPPDMFVKLADENRDKVFRLAKAGENCLRIIPYVHFLIEPPMAGGSESNFHQLYDTLISDPMAFFFNESWVRNRDQAGDGSSGIKRPDFVARFVSGSYALLRGEEKGSRSNGDPAEELVEKLEWTYGDSIPYLLGYYTREYLVTFCSLRCVNGVNLRDDIVSLDLTRAKDRVDLFILCLNFSRILSTLKESCISTQAPPDITEYERESKLVQIFGAKVAKIYRKRPVFERVVGVYSELRDCPYAEVMLHYNTHKASIVFERAFSSMPVTERELVECLRCICEALVWLASKKLMHRDIRWENVAKKNGDLGWVLLDFDEACRSPSQGGARHLKPETHAPEMQLGVHTTAVDVWSVGHLLSTWRTEFRLPRDLEMLKKHCLEATPERRPTATECLSILLNHG